MNEVKQIRMIQLSASLILRIDNRIKITQQSSPLFDYIIETPVDKAICYVKVVDEEYLLSGTYREYVQCLNLHSAQVELDGNTLCLLKLNEGKLELDYQFIGWDDWGEYIIDDTHSFTLLNKSGFGVFLDEIRRHYHVVSLLDCHNMKVVKHVKLTRDSHGHNVPAEIVYLRDLTEDYKMNPIEPTSEEERIEKFNNVHLQKEYPSDILDDAILKAIKTKHPEAVPYNSLLATSTEYRKWSGIKRQYLYQEAEITIIPDLSSISMAYRQQIGTIEGLRFRLDIYITPALNGNLYDNEGFILRLPMNNWLETLNRYTVVLNSLKRIKDLV